MEKQSPSSFEKEFNRLSFLASIATGSTEESIETTQNSSQPLTTVNQNISSQIQGSTQSTAQALNYNENITPQKVTAATTLNSVKVPGNSNTPQLDIEKINKILNSNSQANQIKQQQLIYQNALKQQSVKTLLGMNVQPSHSLAIGTQSLSTQAALTMNGSARPIATQAGLATPSSLSDQQKALQRKIATVTVKAPTVSKHIPIQATNVHTLNSPLIISSSPQKSQSSVVTNTGQTILLPANFAGMTGKVLIVNNPGKPPQAIALSQSGAQTMVSLQSQTTVNNKPVLLLPNNNVGKMGQKLQAQPQLNANAVRMLVAQNNNGVQQFRSIPGSSVNQQMPGLTPVSLSSFQNIRPKAMAQPIRSIQPVPTMNKVLIAPPAKNIIQLPTTAQGKQPFSSAFNIVPNNHVTSIQLPTSNQNKPLSTIYGAIPNHIQLSTPNQGKPLSSSQFNIIPNHMTVPKTTTTPAVSIVTVRATSATSTSLLTNFDRTMSQHLLKLEKTDPHLFKGGKLNIQGTKSNNTSSTPSPLKVQRSQQEKIKIYLQQQQILQQQQQQPQQPQQPTATSEKPKVVIVPTQANTQETKLSNSINITNQGVPTVQTTVRPPANIMPQLLTSLQQQQQQQQSAGTAQQKQQAVIQDMLNKQRLQLIKQQTAAAAAAKAISSTTVQQTQQQQIVSQILAAAASGQLTPQQKQASQQSLEMYLLQQKILQAQQQQQQKQQLTLLQTPTQLNQLTKQMVKPRIDTNIKKIQPTVTPVQQVLTINNSSNQNSNQPLKLLSSLTNMVNSSLTPSSIKVTLSNSAQKTQATPNLVNIVQPGVNVAAPGIQPLLFQFPGANSAKGKVGFKQQFTNAQLLELQKSYLTSQLAAAAGAKPNTAPTALQMGSTSLTINTKIPIQTVSANRAKSAFIPRLNKPATTNILTSNLSQAQINQLIQQGILVSSASALPALAKLQSTATINKTLQEQLKGLSPAQREGLIKQYSAAAAGKQLQVSLANTANPVLVASILKNRQALPTAIMSPKSVMSNLQQIQQQHQQTLKKGPKGPRGYKRTVAEVAPKEPEESPMEKRFKSSLAGDQRKFVHPNIKRPFSTHQDVFARLEPYHLTHEQERAPGNTDKFDLLFNGFANNVIEKKQQLLDTFHHLSLRESMLGWPSADDILIGRLYGSSERERFEMQKKSLSDGRAFIVANKDTGRMECVELAIKEEAVDIQSTQNNTAGLQLSEVDNRLRVASKDIRNCEILTEDEHNNEDEEEEEEEEKEEDDFDDTEEGDEDDENRRTEEIEIEELDGDDIYDGQDNELAAATTNLLADMDDENEDDYGLDFH